MWHVTSTGVALVHAGLGDKSEAFLLVLEQAYDDNAPTSAVWLSLTRDGTISVETHASTNCENGSASSISALLSC